MNGKERIEKSENMGKYKEAYFEACNIMIGESKHAQMLKEVMGFNLNLLKCGQKKEEVDEEEEDEEIKDEESLIIKQDSE